MAETIKGKRCVLVQGVSYKNPVHCLIYSGNMYLVSILFKQLLLFFILHLHEIQFSFIYIIALQADQILYDRISFGNHYNQNISPVDFGVTYLEDEHGSQEVLINWKETRL
jgi:hypothetical protein